jgi:hypothetical protein
MAALFIYSMVTAVIKQISANSAQSPGFTIDGRRFRNFANKCRVFWQIYTLPTNLNLLYHCYFH